MWKNMGTIDRAVRILIAIAIAVLIYAKVVTGLVAIILGVIAVIFVLTSLFGICPLYRLVGLSTGGK